MPKRAREDSTHYIKQKIRRMEKELRRRRRRSPTPYWDTDSDFSDDDADRRHVRSAVRRVAVEGHSARASSPVTDTAEIQPIESSDGGGDYQAIADDVILPDESSHLNPAEDEPDAHKMPEHNGTAKTGDASASTSTQPQPILAEDAAPDLREEVLEILGEAPQPKPSSESLHKDLACRWSHIVKTGLNKDQKKALIERYPPPENCPTFEAPKLNAEAKAAMTDTNIKRDKTLEIKQRQLGCAISALALAVNTMLKQPNLDPEVLKNVSDAARLLCDQHHFESTTRRNFITSGLNNNIKDAVQNADIDTYLFGENLQEKIKASKAIEKSGTDLKNSSSKPNNIKKPFQYANLNPRGPPPQLFRKTGGQQQSAGGPRFQPPVKRTPQAHRGAHQRAHRGQRPRR